MLFEWMTHLKEKKLKNWWFGDAQAKTPDLQRNFQQRPHSERQIKMKRNGSFQSRYPWHTFLLRHYGGSIDSSSPPNIACHGSISLAFVLSTVCVLYTNTKVQFQHFMFLSFRIIQAVTSIPKKWTSWDGYLIHFTYARKLSQKQIS